MGICCFTTGTAWEVMWRDAACTARSQQGGHSFWGHSLTFKLPYSLCLSWDDAKPLEYLGKCLLWWCISPSDYHREISGKLWTLFQAQSLEVKALLNGGLENAGCSPWEGWWKAFPRDPPQPVLTKVAVCLWDPNVWEELQSARMWLSAGGWCHSADCQVKLDLLESRTPYVLSFVLEPVEVWAWTWSPDTDFLWPQCL